MDQELTVPHGYLVGLVDVAHMFVSCERIFNPKLWHKPVVVLSNNDGCIIARSQEAKDLGIAMGLPWFQLAANPTLARQVIAYSSNYELYADISWRITTLLEEMAPYVQQYSIDESFILLPVATANTIAAHIKQTLWQSLGLPVTIGLGSTKGLAKIGSYLAKNVAAYNSICNMAQLSQPDRDKELATIPVRGVWGVGRKLSEKLARNGITTALDLKNTHPPTIRSQYSVLVARIVLELQGKPAIPFYDDPPVRKQLIYSRMFGTPITTRGEMRTALACYADTISRRLRSHQLQACSLFVAISTSRYNLDNSRPSVQVSFMSPTHNASDIARHAYTILPHMHEGVKYARALLALYNLTPTHSTPTVWDNPEAAHHKLGPVIDTIATRFGKHSIGYATNGFQKQPAWVMRRNHCSPRSSTNWHELLEVH